MRRTCLLFIAVLLCAIGACRSQPAPQPTVYHIPVRVVIVLQNGESPGIVANNGCRLSLPQIEDYKEHLNAFAKKSKYGVPIEFDFSATVELYLGTFNRPFALSTWNTVVFHPN